MQSYQKQILLEWKDLLESTTLELKSISEEQASLKPFPEKWSRKEVLGHLCDSCTNNYLRIMNLLISNGDCILQSYDQNEWVKNGAYQLRTWSDIIQLWNSNNHSFIQLVTSAPQEAWSFEGTYKAEKQGFEYLVTDYIVHMKHHFTQIFTN